MEPPAGNLDWKKINNCKVSRQNYQSMEKMWCLDVVFLDAYPTIASWVETGGRGLYPINPSPMSIRKHTRFFEKILYASDAA